MQSDTQRHVRHPLLDLARYACALEGLRRRPRRPIVG